MNEEKKNGLIIEHDKTIYYENGEPTHAGVIRIGDDLYYAGTDGIIATGEKIVHSSMTNGLLKHGTYQFDEDGRLIEGSYIAPKKHKHSKKHSTKNHRRGFKLKLYQKILIGVAALVVLFGIIRFGGVLDGVSLPAVQEKDRTLITFSEYTDEVYLCSAATRRFYLGELTLEQAVSHTEGAAYQPFVFEYALDHDAQAELLLDGNRYTLSPDKTRLAVDNLMTGAEYPYTVTATKGDDVKTYTGSITTASTNRFVYFPGVKNTRDIGGYDTSFGKKVRYGLLIRGTEMDGLVENGYYLTDVSYTQPFHFQYDFDLREPTIYSLDYQSPLGADVPHKFYSAPMYGGIFSKSGEQSVKEIFADLADERNYPMYLHCTYGADRTGTIVFLLQGILGVSDKDKDLEYGLTGYLISRCAGATQLSPIYTGLEGIDGATTNEKIERYLVDQIGVSEQQINRIRSIFLEE